MKIVLSLFLLIVSAFSFADQLKTSETITLDIPSMYCMTCPITVKLSLNKVDGVLETITDLDSKTAFTSTARSALSFTSYPNLLFRVQSDI